MWIILSFEAKHNHAVVTPNKAHFVPTGQAVEESGQHVIELFKDHGIPIGKVATLFGKGRFSKPNCYNHMRDVRSKILEVGDAQGVLEYCESQVELDPRFFYRMQIDDEGKMSNFFCVDARSRMAYKIFGDVIVFDTTYRTNMYEMPLAPFTGVDNHKKNILFGCALVMDEQQDTFEWLFRTWLEAMEGKEPISIITDQDKAISNAIHVVFPSVRHRFCIWHILKKFQEKLPPAYNKSKEFKNEMQAIIRRSLSESHFIEQWSEIIKKYDLLENSWLKKLFDMKKEWVPVFTMDTFFAGMQASQRAESMNSLFSAKVNAGTSLQEFIR
ncbi:unnamed protein product [Cuscuta campestris]|uniref:MULE transposase domain-containing protein n=1 Tax=Cuscuta campestris TaxID=132261 RepID=A0A484LQU4_9ASTE|nr:unnamed protein product [Cuscuta campestris]